MAVNSYLKLGQKPGKTDIVSVLKLIPQKGMKIEDCAQEIAGESSVGTWTEVKTLDKKTFDRLAAKVIYIDKKKGIVKIDYPTKLFEKGNISQLWATVAGNIFSMKIIEKLTLLDVILDVTPHTPVIARSQPKQSEPINANLVWQSELVVQGREA